MEQIVWARSQIYWRNCIDRQSGFIESYQDQWSWLILPGEVFIVERLVSPAVVSCWLLDITLIRNLLLLFIVTRCFVGKLLAYSNNIYDTQSRERFEIAFCGTQRGMSRVDRTLFYNCPPYLLYERPIPYYSIYLLLLYYLVVFECLWSRGWFCLLLNVIIGFCYPEFPRTYPQWFLFISNM